MLSYTRSHVKTLVPLDLPKGSMFLFMCRRYKPEQLQDKNVISWDWTYQKISNSRWLHSQKQQSSDLSGNQQLISLHEIESPTIRRQKRLHLIYSICRKAQSTIWYLLLCLKIRIVAPDSLAPSTSDAWFSSSLKIRQPWIRRGKRKILKRLHFTAKYVTHFSSELLGDHLREGKKKKCISNIDAASSGKTC